MTNKFEIHEDEDVFGKVLVLKDTWSQEIMSYMIKNNIFALRLTDSFGFKANDLSFLSELSFLKSLEIFCWDAKKINAIEPLVQLEALGLQYKSTRALNLSKFHKLKVAKVTWSKGLTSLLELKTIEKLNIQNYPHIDLIPINSKVVLKSLYITSRKLQNLNGINKFVNLEKLDLYNCPQLNSLNGVEECPKLQKIEVEACRNISA